jgi:insecticidal toxin complex protein TccC
MSTAILADTHTGTPTLQVSDARGLMVRTVRYHRREADAPIDPRVTQQQYDALGRLMAGRDPYLFDLARTDESTPFNTQQTLSLSGIPLLTDSVDAGWRVALRGEAGQGVKTWDGRGSHTQYEHDELLRLIALREQGIDVPLHTLERFTYADAGADSAAHNLCGQLCRHDDPAGSVHIHDMSLHGTPLKHTRRFLRDTDAPDWPLEMAQRDALLEPGNGATTHCDFAASAESLSQTDAMDNRQAFAYTVDGQLKNLRLTLAGPGQSEKLLVSDLHYNAIGQVEAETAGNGVITRHRYDEANGRLTELSAHKADGTALQHLKYHYDAMGNVLSIEDAEQPIRYFRNQRIEPRKTYRYDTLDQVIEATGYEAGTGSAGPALPDLQPLPPDPGQIANYSQTYHYDAGGNLLDLNHVGAQAHSRTLTRARYSNRCLLDTAVNRQDEGFDANGNLNELQKGQRLTWDLRNQLHEVRPVVREQAPDDGEHYFYDGDGQRVRKVHSSLTNARAVIREVRYLDGLEIRSHSGTGEILHVISVNAGSNSVQVLHWAEKRPDEIAQDQMRYSVGDHLQSSSLELDQNAGLISQEWFYPFGGTALWAGRNATEAKYKTLRYSNTPRDATGLYYYGWRYYAPWLQRWISPDPMGYVDGVNLFSMVGNNPVKNFDKKGSIRENFNLNEYLRSFQTAFEHYTAIEIRFFYDARAEERAREHIAILLTLDSLDTEAAQRIFQDRIRALLRQMPDPQVYPPNPATTQLNDENQRLYELLTTASTFAPIPRLIASSYGPIEAPPSYWDSIGQQPPPLYSDSASTGSRPIADTLLDPPITADPLADNVEVDPNDLQPLSRSAIANEYIPHPTYEETTQEDAVVGRGRFSRRRSLNRLHDRNPVIRLRTPSPDY